MSSTLGTEEVSLTAFDVQQLKLCILLVSLQGHTDINGRDLNWETPGWMACRCPGGCAANNSSGTLGVCGLLIGYVRPGDQLLSWPPISCFHGPRVTRLTTAGEHQAGWPAAAHMNVLMLTRLCVTTTL